MDDQFRLQGAKFSNVQSYTNWESGHPSNSQTNYMAVISRANEKWNAVPSAPNGRYVVCEARGCTDPCAKIFINEICRQIRLFHWQIIPNFKKVEICETLVKKRHHHLFDLTRKIILIYKMLRLFPVGVQFIKEWFKYGFFKHFRL